MDSAGEIASHDSSSLSEGVVSVKAVDWVESNSVDFDEDFSKARSRYIDRANTCGLRLGIEYERVHGRFALQSVCRYWSQTIRQDVRRKRRFVDSVELMYQLK